MPFHLYFNGEISPLDSTIFKSNDLAILRGYGMFDYFRTYNGVPFRWDDYWQRFENSAKLLKLPLPLNQEEVAEILADLTRIVGRTRSCFSFCFDWRLCA